MYTIKINRQNNEFKLIRTANNIQIAVLERTVRIVSQGKRGLQGLPGPAGADGAPGPTGPQGDPGVGVPTGGTTGQVLAKASNADFDTEFVNPSVGGTSWGDIGGTLSDQTDLQAALDLKTNHEEAIAYAIALG